MHVVMLGVSHQAASVEVREKLGFAAQELAPVLGRLASRPAVREAAILSTCNRTEIYAVMPVEADGRSILADFWRLERGLEADPFAGHGTYYVGEDAVQHLHRVAAGVESLIVGEGQILAQVKATLAAARTAGSAGPILEALLQQALRTGKRVRAETTLGRGTASVAAAAVDLAAARLGDLAGKVVLIYGAGEMSALTARALQARGVRDLYLVNRSPARATEAATRLGCQALSLEAGRLKLAEADLVVCCTSAPRPLLGPADWPIAPAKARLVIDVSVPRNVDPALGALEAVELVDLDGLERVALRHRETRAAQILEAESLIERQVDECLARLATLELAPAIAGFAQRLEDLAEAEAASFLAQQGGLIARDPAAALVRFARQLARRTAHGPIAELKALNPSERKSHAVALTKLFAPPEN